jgi:acetylornithine deacetylase
MTTNINPIVLLKSLIAIPSISKNEQEKSDFLYAFLQHQACNVQRHKLNLWCLAQPYDETKPTLMLNSHMDTVRPSASWTYPPHNATELDGKIIGLGANDAHASLVSLIAVFLSLKDTIQPYNLLLAISAEEEISGINGMESLLTVLPKVDFAIVGEPTQMNLAVAEKGLMVVDCVAKGKSGHAAREEGVNAIYEAMQDIQWFKDYRFEKESELLGPVKMSVTIIQAGTQHNVVPDSCAFSVDIRVNECYSNQQVFDIVKQHILADVTARSFRLNSSSIRLDHPFVKRYLSMKSTIFGSVTLSDQTFMRFPSVKIGVGDSARSHTANEYILISEIEAGIQLYKALIDGLVLR